MGIDNAAGRAESLYTRARDNQYIQRLVEDEELRASLVTALFAGRKALSRISDNKSSAVQSVTSDRRVKQELRTAAESLKDAAERIQEPPRKRRRHPVRRLLLISLITGGVVLAVSESARNALLDAIFGAEEEFVYSSPTGGPETNGAGSPGQ